MDTAFITGASRGIGRALALEFARRGTNLALAARSRDALEETAEACRKLGRTVRVTPLDVRDPAAVRAAVDEAARAFGGLDVVVANAGIAKSRYGGKLTYEDVHDTLEVNVRGAAATLTAAIPHMVAKGRGTLVGISSVVAYRGVPRLAAYSASKAFLSAFLDVLRAELRPRGVRVVDVRPGYVRTQMLGEAAPPWTLDPDDAARRIHRGIVAGRPVVAFPFPLVVLMRLLRALPPSLYDYLAPRLGG